MEFVTAIATSIVGKIAEYTVAPVGRQFGYLFCYTSNVDSLRTRIQELKDAKVRLEHRVEDARRNCEEIEADVQSWLNRVDQISQEAETLLENEGHAKASCSCGSFSHLVTRHQLSRKAKKMTLEVCAVPDASRFDKISYRPHLKSSYEIPKGYETFATRTAILEDIMEALRDVSKSRIGIYGMGGIGKTMLAKEIASQVEKEKLFGEVVMTTISQTPNIKDIQQHIAEKLGLRLDQTESMERRADLLRMRLKQENKILLILDDIWGDLDLLSIGIHFEDEKQGCKMLLTSRSLDVLCNFIGAEENFSIETLDFGEATILFNKIVGDIVGKAEFNSLAFNIIRECAGLPIAITTVAHALKNKNNLSIWKDALQQLKSCDSTMNRIYTKVYSSIKLSYNFLGNDEEVKSLLLLCSLHREDQNIRVEDLMRYSVGWNLLRGVNTMEDARNRVSSLVDKLKSHCLLLDGDDYDDYFAVRYVKVHDVIRDVCISIAMEDKQMYNITSIGKVEEFLNKKKHKESKAISLLEYDDFGKLPKRLESPQLELLLLSSYFLTSVPDDFFEQTRELQALGLNGTYLNLLPSSFHLLQNLQTLCLRGSKLEDVALIGDLKNLKVLDLSFSTVKCLPKRMGELCRLQLLDLQRCHGLKVIEPNVISKLTRLEELYLPETCDGWEVEEDGIDERRKASLTELKNLQQLTVLNLRVSDAKVLPEDLFSEKLERFGIYIGSQHRFYPEARFSRWLRLRLHQRSQLNALGLESLVKRSDYLWLDGLMGVNNVVHDLDREGFPQLKHLEFWNNDGVQYIINSMDQLIHSSCVFPSLETLWLNNLRNLETICHGELPANSFDKLRKVEVWNCGNLRNLFPLSIVKRLENIKVEECEMMEEIVAHGREDHESDEVEFSELRSLYLDLPNKVLQFCWSNEVEATHGSSLIDLPKPLFSAKISFPNLEELTLWGINVEKLWPDQFLASSYMQNLTKLAIITCNSIKYVFSLAMVERLVNLKTLEVADCVAMEEILVIKKLEGQAISLEQTLFPKLESLELSQLPALKRFCSGATQTFFSEKVVFPSLEVLNVEKCNNLKYLLSSAIVGSFLQLKELKVLGCENIEEVIIMKEESGSKAMLKMNSLPKLQYLQLQDLPYIKRFCEGDCIECPSLLKLDVHNCPGLKVFISKSNMTTMKSTENHKQQQEMGLLAKESIIKDKVIFPNLKELRTDDWSEATNEIFDMSQSSIIPVFRNLEVLDVTCRSYDKPISLSIFEFLHRHLNIQRLILSGFFADGIMWQHDQKQRGDGPQANDGTYKLNTTPLKVLTLLDVHILRHLFGDPENAQPSNALSFQTLESLFVQRCSRLQSFALSFMSFHNLTSLTVRECHGLKYLFPSSTATSLVHLKEMTITNCKRMREIINGECYKEDKIIERCQHNEFVFKSLEILILRDLPNLRSFYRGSNAIRFPSLEKLFVSQCPEMRSFSHGIISTFPSLLNFIIAEIRSQSMWEEDTIYLRESAKASQQLWDSDVNTTVRKLWEDNSNFELGHLFAHETDVQNCKENAA